MSPLAYLRNFAGRGVRFLGQGSSLLARAIGNHPLAVLILPTIYFFGRYPPFWNGPDVVGQLLLRAGSVNILHYPPIYSFSARIPFWVTDFALGAGGPTILSTQHPSLGAIYLLVGCQHVALWFSLRYFLFAIPTTAFRRGLVALLLASNSGFYAIAHTCGSEALLPVCWFTVFGSGMRLLQPGGVTRHWTVYSAALLLGIGSRHINGVLLVWLPALCIMLVVGGQLGRVVSAKRSARPVAPLGGRSDPTASDPATSDPGQRSAQRSDPTTSDIANGKSQIRRLAFGVSRSTRVSI